MNQDPDSDFPAVHIRASQPHERTKDGLWRKAGGSALSISIILHAVLLVAALFWILSVVAPKPDVDIVFRGPNEGGAANAKERQTSQISTKLPRVAAQNLQSEIVLPDPEEATPMVQLASIGSTSLSGGLGEGGKGGRGKGSFSGDGTGNESGFVGGDKGKSIFGIPNFSNKALEGTFYDLKQTRDGQPTGMTDSQMRVELKEITRRGFREEDFTKYYKAPRKLYQSRFYIPTMPAAAAPAALEVEKEVQPSMWVAVYRGAVKAPKSGKFRFVGECDDFLVVRFNDRPVFDYGYTMAGTGIHVNGRAGDFNGMNENKELATEVRRLTPNKLPMEFYKYANTAKHNQMIGGLAVGPVFEVQAGKDYPVEIMIGEIPGGFFSVELLIEEIGAKYEKDPAGFPILPLFRLDNGLPDTTGEAAPFDPKGMVWPFSPGL